MNRNNFVQHTLYEVIRDNVKADRTANDLLTQIMLDWRLKLSLKIEQYEETLRLTIKSIDDMNRNNFVQHTLYEVIRK